MWVNPQSQIAAAGGDPATIDESKSQDEFNDFYEEIYDEFAKFGRLEELNVCENLGDHIVGHVYIKFEDEENAAEALQAMFGRYYAGRVLEVEYSPVTDFREARCRQFDETKCERGGYCNFMHIKQPSRWLLRDIEKQNRKRARRERSGSRSRSRSQSRSRSRSRSQSRSPSRSRSQSPAKPATNAAEQESVPASRSAGSDSETVPPM
jgi:splicing factor U2AF subunit